MRKLIQGIQVDIEVLAEYRYLVTIELPDGSSTFIAITHQGMEAVEQFIVSIWGKYVFHYDSHGRCVGLGRQQQQQQQQHS